jgi:hypothetical protein
MDVVAVGGRGVERAPRLADRRGDLDRRQLGHDIAGANGVALIDLDGRELAANLRGDADIRRAYDASNRPNRLGTQQEISAGARGDQDTEPRILLLAMGLPPLDHGRILLIRSIDLVCSCSPTKAASRLPVQAATGCFRKRILVFTPPQSAHSNLWTARSRRVECCSITASFIGLRHLG